MNTYNKIIFVCMGNTCRSPMAATIMQNRLSKYDVIVESRGMVVLFEEPYNPKAVAVAASHNMIMPSNNAIQIANNDFGKDTLVLVMNASMTEQLMCIHYVNSAVNLKKKYRTHMEKVLKNIMYVLNSCSIWLI